MAINFSGVSEQQKADLNSSLEKLKTGLTTLSNSYKNKNTTPTPTGTTPNRPVVTTPTEPKTDSPFEVRRAILSPIQRDGKGGTGTKITTDPRANLNISGPSKSEESKIRREVKNQRRERLQNIENIFDTELKGAQTEGADYEGRSRAINARAGILTSNLGEAQTEKVRQKNNEVYSGINDRKRQSILFELGEIDRIAEEKIAAKQKEAVTNRDDYVAYLKETQDTAKSSIQRIAQAGLPLSDLDEEDFKQLLDTSGMDELTFSAYYNANLPKAQKLDVTYQNLGNGHVGAFWVDPETNTIQNKKYQFPVNEGEDFQVTADGTPLIVATDANGKKTVRIAEGYGQGQFRKPTAAEINGTGGGGSSFKFGSADREVLIGGGYTNEEIDTIQDDIEAGFSFEDVLNNGANDAQKKALRSAFGVDEVEQSKLTRENVAKYYGVTDSEDTKKTGGFLGFGGQSPKDIVDGAMTWIEQQKAVGYTDDQILKALEDQK